MQKAELPGSQTEKGFELTAVLFKNGIVQQNSGETANNVGEYYFQKCDKETQRNHIPLQRTKPMLLPKI